MSGVLEEIGNITRAALDPPKVVRGREKELAKLRGREVYYYVSRAHAMSDETGQFMKTRWVQPVKGDEVWCRFVAQEFAKGDPREDLFAGGHLRFSRLAPL